MKRSGCLVPHQRGRYGCPLSGSQEACPVDHPNWGKKGDCLTAVPTASGARLRHELDRENPEYKALYRQRTAAN